MRPLPFLAATLALLLALPPVSAELPQSESKTYVGPFDWPSPCHVGPWELCSFELHPCLLDAGTPVTEGGACFKVSRPGERLRLTIQDVSGLRAFGQYQFLDAHGNLLDSGSFCGETVTPPMHPEVHQVAVLVSAAYSTLSCGGAAGAAGTITLRGA